MVSGLARPLRSACFVSRPFFLIIPTICIERNCEIQNREPFAVRSLAGICVNLLNLWLGVPGSAVLCLLNCVFHGADGADALQFQGIDRQWPIWSCQR